MHTRIERIRQQAARMRRIVEVPGRDLAATPVPHSSWSAAAQFDHTIKVAAAVLSVLEKQNPAVLPRGISLLGRLVLAIGWIPRGKGKSPAQMLGVPATAAELRAQLTALEGAIERVAAQNVKPSNAPIVKHPMFGGLTRTQALRLVEIHTEHHLKIVGTLAG